MKLTVYKGSDLSKSFKNYAHKVKRLIISQLTLVNGELLVYHINFYYVSGFFTVNGKLFYFSSHDVRWTDFLKMYFRTAKDLKDYTGGQNHDFDIMSISKYNYGSIH